jgi:hypothetical protein
LNVARHFDHVLAHTAVFVYTGGEEQLGSLIPLRLHLRCKNGFEIISNALIFLKHFCRLDAMANIMPL